MNGMHGLADRIAGGLCERRDDLDREFEARLVESSTLAFRVAYGVLRHRQDAEDVAQEASSRRIAASASYATAIGSGRGWSG